jgi:hypothetical protein
LGLEGPARGVAVALEYVWDLVSAVWEEEAAEPPREVPAEVRDTADPRDFLELVSPRLPAMLEYHSLYCRYEKGEINIHFFCSAPFLFFACLRFHASTRSSVQSCLGTQLIGHGFRVLGSFPAQRTR